MERVACDQCNCGVLLHIRDKVGDVKQYVLCLSFLLFSTEATREVRTMAWRCFWLGLDFGGGVLELFRKLL